MITTNILKTDYLYFNRVSSSLSVVFKKKEQESLVSFIWLTYSYFFFYNTAALYCTRRVRVSQWFNFV